MVPLSCQLEGLPNPPYWVWKGLSVNCFRGAAPFPTHHHHHPTPPTPFRAAVAPARCKMISCWGFFPRLENEDSHGIPMEQHSGEIESTTKHYTNTHMHTPTPTCACLHQSVKNTRRHTYTNPPIWTHMLFWNWNQRTISMHCSWKVFLCVKKDIMSDIMYFLI